MEKFEIFSEPKKIYSNMLNDIKEAKHKIYLETYQFDNDYIGIKFRNELIKKASQGVKVAVLIDSWGSSSNKDFFKKLVKAGGRVRFFREFQYVIRLISKNHERNHRKLLLIDDKISYIGSRNITAQGIDWREIVVRFEGKITIHLKNSFIKTWKAHGNLSVKRFNKIVHKSFEIIQDIPSKINTTTEKKYYHLINQAKKEIFIVTPYFIPSGRIRKAFSNAVKRKVKISIIIPNQYEDPYALIANTLRNRYLGRLYNNGINIYTYMPNYIHTKLLIIDKKFFILGSSNLDYRSFIHQFEINIMGKDKKMIESLRKYFFETLDDSKLFNYYEWKKRSSIIKFLELIVYTMRKYV